jgi:polyisoprenoid-binding protein YceI
MEPGSVPGNNRATPGPARAAGRRRLGARDGSSSDVDARWSWLAPLGGDPIRLTPENVTVAMSVRWLGGMIVRGEFREVRGVIHVPVRDDDTAAVTVEIAADSVRTGISLRDRHLRGPLFLDAARHPTISFRGGDVMRLPTHVAVPGSLTIRGVTRTEELRCPLDGFSTGGSLSADLTLSRRAYGVGVPTGIRRLDPLFVVIGDDIKIMIRVRIP